MAEKKNILGIIPARKSSKRIPQKNIRILDNKPLIEYSFETAKKAFRITKLIVSTNDEKVIELADKFDMEVPFIRPEQYSNDKATDFDWVNHAVGEMARVGWKADYVAILRPTTPFRTAQDIDNAIEKILKGKTDSVRSLTKVKHHPYWMKKVKNGIVKPFINVGLPEEALRSQDLPQLYRLNGVVDVIDTRNLKSGKLYGESMGFIDIEEQRSIDIDTFDDFEYCEYLIQKRGEYLEK